MNTVQQVTNGASQQAPVLWGPDGKPISTAGAMVAPNALNFAQILQLPGRLYGFRWDEAMRDNPQNALAMKRDSFYLSLLQERWAPTINLEWQCEVDNEDDPKQKLVQDTMNRLWRDTPDKPNLIGWLLQAGWYGRSGQQGVWGKQETGLEGWTAHEPVNGDSIQFTWDGTPVVLVSWYTAQRYLREDPDAVITMSDRGAYGIKLYKPEYRKRFIIHKHSREASDYFEGEMSGGVHGVGIRSWVYWSGWMRTEIITWMVSFMQSTGMMDLLIFNYADGNVEAMKAQTANAKKIIGKIVLLVPRDPKEKFQAVEQLSMNVAGIEVLKGLVVDYYDRNIERLIVGQSMSAGGGGGGGLEGDGRADFAKDTKYQLCKTDALRLSESLTRDYINPAKLFNFSWADFPVRLVPILRDPADEKKVSDGLSLVQVGVEIAEDELRKAGGYRKPKPGEKTVGKKPEGGAPGQPPGPGQPPPNAGGPPSPNPVARPAAPSGSDTVHADFLQRLRSLEEMILYRAAQPPWPGATFDEQKHRWVSKEEEGKSSGRATSQDEDYGSRAKQLAETIKTFGERAVKMATAVGQKAHELSYRALAFYMENGIDPGNVWEPSDETNLFSNRASTEASAAALGIPLSGPVVKAISTVWAYGITKLKQFIAEQSKSKEAKSYSLFPELYEGGKATPELLTLWAHMTKEFLSAMGVPIPDEVVNAWLASQSGQKDYQLTAYRLAQSPFPGGVFDENVHRWVKPEDDTTGRATKPGSDKPSEPKSKTAQVKTTAKSMNAAKRFTNVALRRRVIKAVRNEGELATAIDGHNFPDSEPADVVHLRDAAGKSVNSSYKEVMSALRKREIAVKTIKSKLSTREAKEQANLLLGQPAHFFEVKTLLTAASGKVHMSKPAQKRKQRWMDRYHVAFHTVIMDDRKGGKHSGNRVYLAPFQIQGTTSVEQCKKMDTLAAVLKHVTEE